VLHDAFRAKEQELVDTLTELVTLLLKSQEDHWARYFERIRQRLVACIERQDSREVKLSVAASIRSAYGGMGSFGDVWLANERLEYLRDRVYTLSYIYQESRYSDGE
jgi:hypothetical protein